jgi:predicted amidohydrolase
MHYGLTDPTTPLIQDQAALGVDTHFTFSADMVTQARLWLQSIRYKFFSQVLNNWRISINNPMSVNQAFTLITRSGALALRRPDLGVLDVGAKADIVVFDGNSPNLLGWSDAVAAIILHSNVGDVEHVMVDGEWRKRYGQLVTKDNVDRNQTNQRFLESARRIQGIWKDMPLPVLEGSQNGVPFAMALMEDVVRGDETGY